MGLRRAVDVLLLALCVLTALRIAGVGGASVPRVGGSPARVGTPLAIDGVPWVESSRHMVLVLQAACPACQASAPFYARITRLARGIDDLRVTIVAPESVETMRPWLEIRGIVYDHLLEVRNLPESGILATPSLVLADEEGNITDIHVGSVEADDEDGVIARVVGSSGLPLTHGSVNTIEEDTLAAWRRSGRRVVLLDVRSRGSSNAGERGAGSVPIPIDELEARLPEEVGDAQEVVVDCRAMLRLDTCWRAVQVAESLGFKSSLLQSQGIQ